MLITGGLLTTESNINGNARFQFYLTLNGRDYQQFNASGTNAYDDSGNFVHDPKLTDIFFPVPDPKTDINVGNIRTNLIFK
mmetsp:Transcript_20082/g.23174  ORF Transcript_20082/g.23174 Transcript_20082/m.23174 type:complete len:81 (+) Transcript_20082:119-361(+)